MNRFIYDEQYKENRVQLDFNQASLDLVEAERVNPTWHQKNAIYANKRHLNMLQVKLGVIENQKNNQAAFRDLLSHRFKKKKAHLMLKPVAKLAPIESLIKIQENLNDWIQLFEMENCQ